MNATVVIATCGSDEWKILGDKAQSSIYDFAKIIRVHESNATVSEARNIGLEKVETEYVVFLDADDTLDYKYLDFEPETDITVTSIRYNYIGKPMIPKVWQHEKGRKGYHIEECSSNCLLDGNYVHVGAIMKTEAIKYIGGFKEYPVYEDYALFLELQQNGFTFSNREESIYEASVRKSPGHRNRSLPLIEKNKIHEKIYEDMTGLKWSK